MKKIVLILLLVLSLSSCTFLRRQADLAEQKKPPFTVDLSSPRVPAGQIEAQFNRAFPATGIRKSDVNVIYFPEEDAVCLQFRLNSYTYHQFWHSAGREAFLTALNNYNNDFDGQKLRNRNTRTKKQYGTVEECYVTWQMASLTVLARGNMEIELGYYFRDDSPFFAITQMEAYFESPTLDREKDDVSPEIPMFLTRAQAEELAALFSQDYLSSIAPDAQSPEARRGLFSR